MFPSVLSRYFLKAKKVIRGMILGHIPVNNEGNLYVVLVYVFFNFCLRYLRRSKFFELVLGTNPSTASFTDLDCCFQADYFESIMTTLEASFIF
jgi:hypothetical protein